MEFIGLGPNCAEEDQSIMVVGSVNGLLENDKPSLDKKSLYDRYDCRGGLEAPLSTEFL